LLLMIKEIFIWVLLIPGAKGKLWGIEKTCSSCWKSLI
jgi:hypothetical protein